MACEDRHNELVNFGIEDYGTAEFDKVFPKWKKQIEKSKEVTEGSSSHGDDDAPFD
jgi:hypothetical protein